jgi:hypothetical protein
MHVSAPAHGWAHAGLVSAFCLGAVASASAEGRHLALNLGGDYEGVAEVGFTLADVGSPELLDTLPDGLSAVLWLGNGYNTKCEWRLSDAEVEEVVVAVRDHPKFSGIYYIADEPHPTACPDAPEAVARRSELVRSLDPDARTLILVQNGSKAPDEFSLLAGSADLIGVLPYPCNEKNATTGCDLKALRARIEAALDAGIAVERIVPVFQTFGQACIESGEPYYRLPSVEEAKRMLGIWDELVPREVRTLDMAYTWGSRPTNACPSLKMADGGDYPDLRSLYADYFAGRVEFGVAANDD